MAKNREQILHILEQADGYVSGESLAEQLGLSRAAIWKEIGKLRDDGYEIESRTNKGYRLRLDTDLLDAGRIQQALHGRMFRDHILILESVGSTNDELRRLAAEGAPTGTVLLANSQTDGKGRRGRSFASPKNSGIYMSLLLRPDIPMDRVQFITIIAALSVADALEETAGFQPSVKWVNDVLYQGKKLCGILTEGSFSGEAGQIESLVVGIGINVVSVKGYPEELRSIVTSVFDVTGEKASRCKLAAAVLDRFEGYYNRLHEEPAALLAYYRSRLGMLGSPVEVIGADARYPATAVDVSERGGLIVKKEDGSLVELNSGEISIRPGKKEWNNV